jgi:hypothetical protein
MGSLDAALEYVRVDSQGRIVDVAGRRKKTVVPQATSVYVGTGILLGVTACCLCPHSPPYPHIRVVRWRSFARGEPALLRACVLNQVCGRRGGDGGGGEGPEVHVPCDSVALPRGQPADRVPGPHSRPGPANGRQHPWGRPFVRAVHGALWCLMSAPKALPCLTPWVQ